MKRDKAERTKVTYDAMWQTFLQFAEVSGCAAPFTQEKAIRAWEIAAAAGYSFGAIVQNMRSAIVWKRLTRKGLRNALGEKTASWLKGYARTKGLPPNTRPRALRKRTWTRLPQNSKDVSVHSRLARRSLASASSTGCCGSATSST
jgi:hypothetical protein